MRRLGMATALLMAVALGLFAAGTERVSAGARICPDFDSQAEAQRYFQDNGGSPTNNATGLDDDHDGIACEAYFGGGSVIVDPPASISPSVSPGVTPSWFPSAAPSWFPSTAPSRSASISLPPTASTEPSDVASLAPSEISSTSPSPVVSAEPSVEIPVELPGVIAPEAITVQAFTVIDEVLAPTIDYMLFDGPGSATDEATGPARNPSDAMSRVPGMTIVVIDQATGLTVDTGTTDADGLVTLDGEVGVPVFVIVGGTDVGSDPFTVADGGTASVDVVIYRLSGEPSASFAPSVAPSVEAVAPSAAGGAISLPNTGAGSTAPSSWAAVAGLLTAVLTIGAGALVLGRRRS